MSGALDYDGLKRLAHELGRPASTLIVLSSGNDPFYITPARKRDADWFANLWHTFGFARGVHLRRVHYIIVSQPARIITGTGKPYLNTERCWAYLGKASAAARYLGLVPAEAFVDRRNDDPIIHLSGEAEPALAWVSDGSLDYEFGEGHHEMPSLPRLRLSPPEIPQRYAVEVWAEKTTQNEILVPLAQRYGANVVTGSGELSITACLNVVERARQHGRPTRILYISDFDPAGASMPVAVARKIEHEIRTKGHELDIQVRPIALTAEQCVQYNLPRTPLKDSERRAAAFEARHGEGATELDALEALHPGALRKIVETEIRRYHDPDLRSRVARKLNEVVEPYTDANERIHDRHESDVDALRARWEDIGEEIERWRSDAVSTWQAIASDLRAAAPDLSGVDWPEPREGDEDPDPLFDSCRGYVEQVDRYKRHQGKPTARRPRKQRGAA